MPADDTEAIVGQRPQIARTIDDLRARVAEARRASLRVGLVPTMGALHAGHLSLITAAASECEFNVVSVFVNPTQFGEGEDFQQYPRQLESDRIAAGAAGADLIFAPSVETMYGDDDQTLVEPAPIAARWEGAHRPGHFRGVATIVLKLFLAAAPDAAYLGRKDYQQSLVVQQLVKDFDLPIEIRVQPTVREQDGLALSSRNAYLTVNERRQAQVLSRSLRTAVDAYRTGTRQTAELLSKMQACFDAEPDVSVDYLAVADGETLEPVEKANDVTVVLVAARVGKTRLIDNCLLGEGLP